MTTTAATYPLRILVVEFLPSGGMYQFAYQFADALARQGHMVTLLTGPDPEFSSQTTGLTVVEGLPTWHPNAVDHLGPLRRRFRRGTRALRLLESWRRVLAYARRGQFDVIQFGELRYALDTASFLAVARWGLAETLVDVAHNPLPYDVNSADQAVEKSGRLTIGLLRRAYEACDLVLVLGEGPRAELLEHFPGVRRTAICGHGDYSAVLRQDAVAAPSLAGPSALFFGAWTKYKNLPLLLEAFALLRREIPAARLTLAGPLMPDVDLQQLATRAEEIGNVALRPGYVAMEDLPNLFADHRVVMFTYETVNISGSVHMAYTFGRPVIATAVGSMTDVVADGRTGRLVPPQAAAIAAAMAEILGDDDVADSMGKAARLVAQSDASWSAVAERATAAYLNRRVTASATHH
ncbi:MAG: glycosyltransferase family 4 protein [Microlunatus sp.]